MHKNISKKSIWLVLIVFSFHCNAQTPDSPLSSNERNKIYLSILSTIESEYYDSSLNGVNLSSIHLKYDSIITAAKSNKEFYGILKQMLLEFKDLHTSLVSPEDHPGTTGITVVEVNGKVFIENVDSASEATAKGVKKGMIIRLLNDKPIEEYVKQLELKLGNWQNKHAWHFVIYSSLLGGQANTPLTLNLIRSDDSELKIDLIRKEVKAQNNLLVYKTPSAVGYIKVLHGLISPVDDEFENNFDLVRDAKGIIIDLRGVSGGDMKGIGLKIANHFFDHEISFGKFVNRFGDVPPFRNLSARGSRNSYQGPVVIIVDEGTRSAGEVFADGFQESGRAKIIGINTCGSVLDRDSKKLYGGGVLFYSQLAYVSAKGQTLEGTGVKPNIPVEINETALRAGRDIILEEAEKVLK